MDYCELLPLGEIRNYEERPIIDRELIYFKTKRGDTLIRPYPQDTKEMGLENPEQIKAYLAELKERTEKAKEHLGKRFMPNTHHVKIDGQGKHRVYTQQNEAHSSGNAQNIRVGMVEKNEGLLISLTQVVDRLRTLIKKENLIPDLSAPNSVIINECGLLKIMGALAPLTRILSNEEWQRRVPGTHFEQDLLPQLARMPRATVNRWFLASEYLNKSGLPVADLSLTVLRKWEKILKRDIEKDPLYAPLTLNTRLRLIAFLENLNGDILI